MITGAMSNMSEEEQKRLQESLRPLRDRMVEELHMEEAKPPAYAKGKPITLNW